MNFFAGAYFDSSSKKRKILLFFLDNLQSSVTLINDESMSHCAGDVMIHKQSLKTKVKEYILELIREKELKAGDRLPPQRELARICGSSPKIAEIALSEMEAEGDFPPGGAGIVSAGSPENRIVWCAEKCFRSCSQSAQSAVFRICFRDRVLPAEGGTAHAPRQLRGVSG